MRTKRHGPIGVFRTLRNNSRRNATRAPWMAVGALVASAALAGPAAGIAHASGTWSSGAPLSATSAVGPVWADTWRADDQPAADTTPYQFAIPASPLGAALASFEATTGVKVQLPADTPAALTSGGVTGWMTSSQALARLLEGTSLGFRFTGAKAATIEIRVAQEAVEVLGRLPRVDSPKYATTLTSTPQTIQVIPRAVMEQQGVLTLSDALRNVPGITMQAGEGGGASSTAGDMFNMRGFNASNSLFVDGVRDDGLISRDVYNLEQVEVFMGPTGSDVGRGNAAGYVNMSTKAPRLGDAYSGTVSYGSQENKRLTLDANKALPLGTEGEWLHGTVLRVNALWQDGGVAGRDYASNERLSIAPTLAFGLGTPTRVTLSGQFTRQDNVPDYGVPGAAWTEPLAPTSVLTTRSVDQSTFYGSAAYDYDRADQDSGTAKIEHDLNSAWTVRNQTRFNKTNREAVITSIGSATSFVPATETLTVSRQVNVRENQIFANQTSATGRLRHGNVSHAINLGLEVVSEDYSAPGMIGGGTRLPFSIYTPNAFDTITDFNPAPSGATTDGTTDTVAVSAFDVVNIGARLQVNGGLRVERYSTDYAGLATTGVLTEVSADDNIMSGKAGALFQFRPNGNVYVSYGTSVTPPGAGNFALSTQANNANNPNVDPQVSKNLEVGTKWDFFGSRLSTSLAVFDTRNENVIYTVDAAAVPPVFNQDDAQKVQGATIGVVGQISDHWSVMANFAYLDATLDTQGSENNGNRLSLTPETSGSLWTSYSFPKGFTLGGGIRFTGDVFVNTANTIRVPGYQIVDAVASYAVNSHLTLRLNVYNLTDEVYIRNVSNNGGRYNPGYTRSVLFGTSLGF